MHDMERFWETLQEIPSNTSVQGLVIHLSEFLKEGDEREGSDQSSEQDNDQE